MKILALTLARGGSVRVPKKNIRLLNGRPLLEYTIEAAKKSRYINRIIVSTDDLDISEVATNAGAEVPVLRPKEISQSDSLEIDAFKHILNWLKENEGYEPDLIVKLFPTSPFRTTETIDKAIKLMIDSMNEVDSLRSVRLVKEHPYKMWKIEGKRLVHLISDKPEGSHTFPYHLLPQTYVNNACIDVTKPSTIWLKNSITGKIILPFIMSEFESFDINTPLDFIVAELIMKVTR